MTEYIGAYGEGGYGEHPYGGYWAYPDRAEERTYVGGFGSGGFGSVPFGGYWIYEDLYQTIDPPEGKYAHERLVGDLKRPYEGEQWDAYITAWGNQFADLDRVANSALAAQYVETGQLGELDVQQGQLVNLSRKSDEDDPRYRHRLITEMRTNISGGTYPEIKDIASALLDVQESAIDLSEDHAVEPARYTMQLSFDTLEDAGVSTDEFVDYMNRVSAAGVRPVITTTGSFEYRSYQDYLDGINDPSKGYNEGRYAGRL